MEQSWINMAEKRLWLRLCLRQKLDEMFVVTEKKNCCAFCSGICPHNFSMKGPLKSSPLVKRYGSTLAAFNGAAFSLLQYDMSFTLGFSYN